MSKSREDCLAGAMALLCKAGVMSLEEVVDATEEGYDEVFSLIEDKFSEMEDE